MANLAILPLIIGCSIFGIGVGAMFGSAYAGDPASHGLQAGLASGLGGSLIALSLRRPRSDVATVLAGSMIGAAAGLLSTLSDTTSEWTAMSRVGAGCALLAVGLPTLVGNLVAGAEDDAERSGEVAVPVDEPGAD